MLSAPTNFGFVVIGRNEGERLKRCVLSLPEHAFVVYVDSGSTDGSVDWVRARGIDVIELDTQRRFTAARARNAGFRRLKQVAPGLAYVQFVDGDCELAEGWARQAASYLDDHDAACAVFGRLRERDPSKSVYNWLCDKEWDVPVGAAKSFGGIVMIRAAALDDAGGYRDDMIAGEEPELCVRLGDKGWQIWRIDHEMALHDAAMTRLDQWWWRHVRGGYAFAEGAHLHGDSPKRHWIWEARRAMIWGVILPTVCALASLVLAPWGLAAWLIYPLQMLRLFLRGAGPMGDRALLAVFSVITRFPEGHGYMKFVVQRMLNRQSAIIEYK
jgi:GT2 family glycosyltransferase